MSNFVGTIALGNEKVYPNVDIQGSVTIEDGVIQPYHVGSIARFKFLRPEVYDCYLKIKTPATAPSELYQDIFCVPGIVHLDLATSGYFCLKRWGSDGTDDIVYESELDKDYWVKIGIVNKPNEKSFSLSVSEDGETWSETQTQSVDVFYTTYPGKQSLYCGLGRIIGMNDQYYADSSVDAGIAKEARSFQGTIDLKECYVKHGDKILWEGMTNKLGLGSNEMFDTYPKFFDQVNNTFVTIAEGASMSKTTKVTYSLADYLPNDGYTYEVLCFYFGFMATSGYYSTNYVVSGTPSAASAAAIQSKIHFLGSRVYARTSATWRDGGAFWVPIFPGDRNISIVNLGSYTTTNYLYLARYRRAGTNSTSNTGKLLNINDKVIGGHEYAGKWNINSLSLLAYSETGALTYGNPITYSLDDYLPKDDSNYLVNFTVWGGTETSGSRVYLWLCPGTGYSAGTCVALTESHSDAYQYTGHSVALEIQANDRNITIAQASSSNPRQVIFMAKGYRRLNKVS